MLELRTLGGLELRRSAGGTVHPVPLQTKRLALLAYLASAPSGDFRRRDSLLALFWPELDQEHARGALRQAVHALRRALADDVVITRGIDEIGIAADAVRVDARLLEVAVTAGRHAEALALYRGDFLDGVFISDAAAELDEWIAAERVRFRRLGAAAAWGAAESDARDPGLAGRVHAALELSGDDEAALRRGMALLERAGDRAGAAAAYETFARRIRRELDVDPAEATQAAVRAIRSRREPAAAPARDVGDATADPAPPGDAEAEAAARRAAFRRPLVGGGVAAGLVLVIALVVASNRWQTAEPASRAPFVAVFPFAVTAPDSSLAWLGEGLVELLGRRLGGPDGWATAGVPAAITAWSRAGGSATVMPPRDRVLAQARRLGASEVILGSVVKAGGDVVVGAELLALADGRTVAEAEVRGQVRDIALLVDSLAVRLLAMRAGADAGHLGVLVGMPLPAVRAYLSGRAAARHGDWETAVARFDQALAADSTFASAAIGLRAATAALDNLHGPRAEALAWRHRDRLDPREYRVFMTEVGPRYPEYFAAADRLAAWRALVTADWTNSEAWAHLGRTYLFHGARLDVPDPLREAAIALERALDLDPAGATPLRQDLEDLAALTGDTALLRRVIAPEAPNAGNGARLRDEWLRAFAARDAASLRGVVGRLEQLDDRTLARVRSLAYRTGFWMDGAAVAEELLARRADTDQERAAAAALRYQTALNRGRPRAARDIASQLVPEWRAASRRSLEVLAGLYGGGDSAAAAAAAEVLRSDVERPLARDPAERRSQLIHTCVHAQWELAHGRTRSVARAIEALSTPEPAAPGWATAFYATCAAALKAWQASLEGRPETRALVERLDSLARTNAVWHWAIRDEQVLARLWERAGEPTRALRALRRRRFDDAAHLGVTLREEGRLAEATGDTAAARRAYRHYLALRADPEPALRAERDAVRAAITRLAGGGVAYSP
jgi:serine/threonine-protein kinase